MTKFATSQKIFPTWVGMNREWNQWMRADQIIFPTWVGMNRWRGDRAQCVIFPTWWGLLEDRVRT